jgi:serine/threonine-protein kinase
LGLKQVIGSLLGGRYEIREEIGHGGMARVYRAFDTKLRRDIALKVLAPQLSADPEFIRRFEREAQVSGSLNHVGIVTVYDIDKQDDQYYIAMEFIEGRSLHAVVKEHGALGLGYAVSILEPLGQALDYAHSRGAVHRDVKPHNVMLATDGRVLLTDFGIAQPPDSEGERLTRAGIFMGTPEYISPEQLEARRVDGKSDLYSFAIVAYEIVTGQVPFSGNTPQLILAHTQTPPPLPSTIVPSLPRELDGVLGRALAKNPSERFDSVVAFVEDLKMVARRYGVLLASQSQISTLARMPDSAGQQTIAISSDATPIAPQPSIPPPSESPIPTDEPYRSSGPYDDTYAVAANPYHAPSPQGFPLPASSEPPSGASGSSGGGYDEDERGYRRKQGIGAPLILAIVLAVASILALALVVVVFGTMGDGQSDVPLVVTDGTGEGTDVPLPPPTDTPVPTPTGTPDATDTPGPTPTETLSPTPSNTPLPTPTNTPVPPTNTLRPTPTLPPISTTAPPTVPPPTQPPPTQPPPTQPPTEPPPTEPPLPPTDSPYPPGANRVPGDTALPSGTTAAGSTSEPAPTVGDGTGTLNEQPRPTASNGTTAMVSPVASAGKTTTVAVRNTPTLPAPTATLTSVVASPQRIAATHTPTIEPPTQPAASPTPTPVPPIPTRVLAQPTATATAVVPYP